jgi:Branched-chain amino acid ATP-binding cassette transporter
VVLDRGRHIAEGSADDILNSPAVIQAYLGDGHMGKGGTDVPAPSTGERA